MLWLLPGVCLANLTFDLVGVLLLVLVVSAGSGVYAHVPGAIEHVVTSISYDLVVVLAQDTVFFFF